MPGEFKQKSYVLCFPVFKTFDENQNEVKRIIMARRKKPPMVGILDGYGGEAVWDEELADPRCRKRLEEKGESFDDPGMLILNQAKILREKAGVLAVVQNLVKLGEIIIKKSDSVHVLYVFVTNIWKGRFSQTDEMFSPETMDAESELPYEKIAPEDVPWISKITRGEYFHAEMEIGSESNVLSFKFV